MNRRTVDTKFGQVTIISQEGGKIVVLIDDITATFNEKEFWNDFALEGK